jgi:hypothetical protein
MTLNFILYVIIALALIMFLIIATKKKWISWKAGTGIAHLTAFHDFVPKDRQAAIEIMVEKKAHKKTEEQESGQDKNPGEKKET